VKAPSPGEAAVRLPWLAPRGASLVALSRSFPPAAWPSLKTDPGLLLLLARHVSSDADLTPAAWDRPEPLEVARNWLGPGTPGFADWNHPCTRPVLEAALTFAGLARSLAEESGRADAGGAELGAMLAPLGWLAVCAVAPERVAECRSDPAFADRPLEVQRQHWGLDAAAIARRLVRRWRLPGWLGALAGYLHLPAEVVTGFGPVPIDLVRVVQLAVALGQRAVRLPLLTAGVDALALAAEVGLTPDRVETAERRVGEFRAQAAEQAGGRWDDPRQKALLPELLTLAAEYRRAAAASDREALEAEADRLQDALARETQGAAARVQTAKLSGLAELAAGAGHEINNPLAVISGQGQYLLTHEQDPARQKALQTIIGQTRRIHDILSGLMQFARPSRPQPEALDVALLVEQVFAGLRELAGQRQVNLGWQPPAQPAGVWGDARQVPAALGHLVRNAVEATPAGGWVRVRLEPAGGDRLTFAVEDSGPGPAPAQRSHLFDPFFSGRPAGRGRGLGLPTAWRLAHLQGGDVVFDPQPGGPTRFLLTLPRCPAPAALPERKSA
jgi:signal transduction histidine kinase